VAFLVNFAFYADVVWKFFPYPSDPIVRLAWILGTDLIVPGVTLGALLLTPLRAALLSVKWPKTARQWLGSILLGVFVGLVALFPVNIITSIVVTLMFGEAVDPVASSAGQTATLSLGPLYLASSAAVAEEFIFRYLPLAYLSLCSLTRRQTWLAYLCFAALLFAACHWTGGARFVVSALLYGVLFAALFFNFRNLVVVVIGHFTIGWIAITHLGSG
jgi:hypothetical protein